MVGEQIWNLGGIEMMQINIKQLGVILIVLLGMILAFSPFQKSAVSNNEATLLASMIEERHDHISADQLGQLIIDKSPEYMLIDIRQVDEYKNFHIPTAYNFPLESLFRDSVLARLDPDKLLVLYSNGGTHAAQAWVLLRQLGFQNSTVLLGGLNYWVDVYSNPHPPEDIHADSEVFLYQFRMSAGKTLLGEQTVQDQKSADSPTLPAIPIKRKIKKSGDEGC
jgi:rhodanese-related sulfurtransferase